MPKRSVYLQPPDNPCRRTRRDIEFLCNYWDRLLALNRSYDVRLPELLRANHLIRHLSPLPTNHGLRVDVSFTVFDENDFSRPNNVYAETYQLDNAPPYYAELRNSGSCRLSRNGNAARCNNLLRDYARRASENYATERELIRAGVLASLIDRGRIAGCQSALYNQRQAAASNYRFPAGSRASAMRVLSGQHDRYVNPRRMNNCHACASFRQKCCAVDSTSENVKPAPRSTSQQPLLRQEKDLSKKLNHSPNTANQRYCQHSLPTSFSGATLGNLQTNDKTPKNRGTAPLEREDDATKRGPEEPTEARRDGTVGATTKTAHTGSYVKPAGVAVNNEGGSIDPWLSGCPKRGNVSPESIIVTDRDRRADDERGPDDMEDRATAVDLDRVSRDPTWANVKSRVKNTPKAIPSDESATRTAKSRIRNGRSTEMKLSSRRHSSSPKYASFLRMFRKKEVPDQRFRENPSSFRENESNEKSQRREGPSAESTSNDNRAIREDPRIERRVPTPRSTVHTTYNPIMHSSASDPILDSSGITIQLLRLAALMPALMPALNSLIAQQNHQTSVSLPSSEGGSSDTWSQVLRLLNEQQATANVSLISAGSERDSSVSRANADTGAGNSPVPSEERKDTSIAVKKPSTSQRESPCSRRSEWKSDECRARQGGKDRKWRLASMLDSGVRLDRSIFATEDFWKLEEFSKTGRRPENAQSLSTRSKNEIVVKEDLRDWMRRLLRQLDARGAGSNSSSNDEEAKGHPEGSSRTTNVEADEFSWRGIKRRGAGRSVADESPNSSKDNSNVFTEHEEEDSDDQKSLTSVASTNSSKSLRLKQDDARKNENETLKD